MDDDLEPEGCTVAGLKAHIEDAFDLLRSKQLLSYHGTPLLDPDETPPPSSFPLSSSTPPPFQTPPHTLLNQRVTTTRRSHP